jgi:ribonucleoside-diphosphate reductase alpha chain
MKRPGAIAIWTSILHKDTPQLLRAKDHLQGDHRKHIDCNIGLTVPSEFIQGLLQNKPEYVELWALVLETQLKTGSPYLMFEENVNNHRPESYLANNLKVSASNICVVGSTKILTSKGYKPIKDLVDTYVDVWNGKQFSNVKINKTGENQELVTVKTNSGSELTCTPYHKFYVKKHDKESNTVEIVEKRANELLAMDELISANLPIIEGTKEKTVSEFYKKPKKVFTVPSAEYSIKSRLNWLSVLLDATAYFNAKNSTVQIDSFNKTFLLDLQLMLQTLGTYSSVNVFIENSNINKPLYQILINSFGIQALLNLGLKTSRLNLKDVVFSEFSVPCIKVTEVIKEDYLADVYCFNEPLEYKGMFNGILTGNCSEITLYTDKDHTFVCCLCSLNLSTWEQWKRWKGQSGKSVAELAVYLLDTGLDDYILKASKIPELAKAVRSAQKERSIGVGTMGLHYLYQSKGLPFKSYKARQLNKKIFAQIQEETNKASVDLGIERGIPQWCVGRRNALTVAVAPTRTNSVISGAFSAGIEPNDSNYYVAKQSKGNFIRRNKHLEFLLEFKGKNTEEVWDSILFKNGSVFHLEFLTFDEKLVFATAREIDQQELIRQASERQPFIDQSQSLNRFYHPRIPVHIINEHIITAYHNNIKTLYYTRTASPQQLERVKGDCYIVTKDDCKYCKLLKELLVSNGIRYTEIDKSEVEHFPWRTVPQIWYEGCYIGGYNDMKALLDNKQADVFNQPVFPSTNLVDASHDSDCTACEA